MLVTMARRRTSTSTAIVRAVPIRAPAPVIRIAAPRSISAPKHKKRVHHRRGASSGTGSVKTLIGCAVGGAALGFIEKHFPTIPTVPVIGRAGTIAVAAHFLSKQGGTASGLLRDIAIAGSVIAGYQLGKDGKVSGDDVSGDLAEQVRGLAAQV